MSFFLIQTMVKTALINISTQMVDQKTMWSVKVSAVLMNLQELYELRSTRPLLARCSRMLAKNHELIDE